MEFEEFRDFMKRLVVPDEELGDFADWLFNISRQAMVEAKQELVRNGPDDLEPKMMYMGETHPGVVFVYPVMIQGAEMYQVVEIVLGEAARQFGAPRFFCFISEAYMKKFPKGTDVGHLRRGDIARMTDSTEALTIAIVHRLPDGGLRQLYAALPFHYGDGGIIFDEEDSYVLDSAEGDTTEPMGGAITDAIVGAFKAREN